MNESLSWRAAREDDAAAVRALAEPREAYATGFSYRVCQSGSGRLRLRTSTGGLFVLESASPPGSLSMAVYMAEGGTAFPVLAGAYDDGGNAAVQELSRLLSNRAARSFHSSACAGAAEHVAALETAFGWRAELRVEYDAMSMTPHQYRALGTPAGGVEYRRATPEDIDALYPIAESYERAEVLTRLHSFDKKTCRASQVKALERQIVYLASVDGLVVARAQTNARGWSCDQIGGVFVLPRFRERGIGRGVVGALLKDLNSRGRAASLFVKKTNEPAKALYLSMGFAVARDYRVSYYV
ncbi:MAG: GNAT family N-acetyltransferase [Spirochaetales bacterium]|nr:GNAT family N-acetyltransferase [Spirochaetales bacterium]